MTELEESQELLQKAVELKQQSEEVERQLDFVNEQIKELEQFSKNLALLETEKEKEILASLGKGVYIKAKRDEDEKFFVEVGSGVMVRKTSKEAREIIKEQIGKFQEARVQLTAQLQSHAEEFRKMLKKVERVKKGETSSNENSSNRNL